MGSFFGNVGNAIKGGVVGAGHLVGKVASNPVVQGLTAAGLAATGVGAPAAAAIMAAERGGGALLRPGGNIGQGIRGGVEGAAIGYGAAKAGGLVRGALGRAGLPSSSGGVADASAPGGGGVGGIGGVLGAAGGFLKGHAGQIAGAAGGLGGAASSLIGDHLGGINPFIAGLAGLQAKNAADLGGKADEFANKGWDYARGSYDERAPLRAAGLSGLLNPANHDLSGLSAIRGQNPVAARTLGSGPPVAPRQLSPAFGSSSASGAVAANPASLASSNPSGDALARAGLQRLSSMQRSSESLSDGPRTYPAVLTTARQ